jgi:hypothetical protein
MERYWQKAGGGATTAHSAGHPVHVAELQLPGPDIVHRPLALVGQHLEGGQYPRKGGCVTALVRVVQPSKLPVRLRATLSLLDASPQLHHTRSCGFKGSHLLDLGSAGSQRDAQAPVVVLPIYVVHLQGQAAV